MQDCHWQSETKFGDLILPASTNFEHEDISEWAQPGGYGNGNVNCNHRILMYQQKCIEPLGESKSDYEIFAGLAERLGIYDAYTMGGKTDLDWVKQMFHASDLPTRDSSYRMEMSFPDRRGDSRPAVRGKGTTSRRERFLSRIRAEGFRG